MTTDPSTPDEGRRDITGIGRQDPRDTAPGPGRSGRPDASGDPAPSTATTHSHAGPPAGRDPQPAWAPEPGWYLDPLEPRRLRYWTGREWTSRTRPTAGETRTDSPPTPHHAPATDEPSGRSDRTEPPPTPDRPLLGADAPTTPRTEDVSASWGRWEAPGTAPESPTGMRPVSAVFTAIPTVLGAGWRPLLLLSMAIWSASALLTTTALLIAVDVTGVHRTVLGFVDAVQRAGDLATVRAAWESSITAVGTAVRWSGPTTTLLLAVLASGLFLLCTLMITGSIRIAQRALGEGGSDHPARTADAPTPDDDAAPRPFRLAWCDGLREAFVRLPRVIGTCAVVMPALALPWLLLGLWLPLTIWVVTTGSVVVLSAVVGVAIAALCLMMVTAGRLTPALPRAAQSRAALRWSWRVTRGRFWAVLARIAVWLLVLATVIQLVLGVVLAPMATVGSPEDANTWLAAGLLWLLSVPGYVTVTGWYAIGLVPIAADLAAQESAPTENRAGSDRQPDPAADLSGPGSPPPSGSAAS